MKYAISLAALALFACANVAAQGEETAPPPPLKPESLADAQMLGGRWNQHDGNFGGSGAKGNAWLLFDQEYQDVEVGAQFRCPGACRLGLLLRAARTQDGGWSGILVPIGDPGRPAERVALNEAGVIIDRIPLPIGFGATRVASQPPAGASSVPKPRDDTPDTAPFPPPDSGLRGGDWNSLRVTFDANVIRAGMNDGHVGTWIADANGYGSIALLVEEGSRAEFRKIAITDLGRRTRKPEVVSDHFRKQVLNDFFYGWSAAAGDVDRDGAMDIVSGPFIYYGPDFRRFREFSLAEPANPTGGYPTFFEQYVADFTGDGWPDILAVRHAPPFGQLYVNPQGENRRWEVSTVLDLLVSETTALADIDGDGRAELVYAVPGELRAARPDPANPTSKWVVETLSSEGIGPGGTHGLGVGDLTGDGMPEIVSRFGWWEPAETEGRPWRYHAHFFGRHGPGGAGGAEMAVYDVNGDGLNDVVTALSAHGYGLAWFEQQRESSGAVDFVRHLILDGPGGENAGNVVFSQAHAVKAADLSGDGVPDLITGKRYFSHLETPSDPDTWGEPVLYWYEVVRDSNAPGGARFVPHLIDNRSGVGSALLARDIDSDGEIDLVTATRFGTALFWNLGARSR